MYFCHGIMERWIPDGGLLRYRKWVPQQLGDVIVVTNSPPVGRMRSRLTNHQVGIVLAIRAWSEKLYQTSRRGRKDRKLFGIGVPIIPWSETSGTRIMVGHHSYSFQGDSNMNAEEVEYTPIGGGRFCSICTNENIWIYLCSAAHFDVR